MDKLLKRKEVEERAGIGRAHLYALMNQGKFPRPLRVGIRAVRWREADVQAWIDERAVEAEPPRVCR